MLVDWHAHYPMRVVSDLTPSTAVKQMRRMRWWPPGDLGRALILSVASRIGSHRSWWSDYRVTPEGLRAGNVGVALSVLLRPLDEMDLSKRYGAPPESAYFPRLLQDLEAVEEDVAGRDPSRIRIAHNRRELEEALTAGATALVHCVEGGFHLGGEPEEIKANCAILKCHGVAYVTVAHLFFREIATNAPALPFLPDWLYNRVFPQGEEDAVTELGEALLEGLFTNRILPDLSHMSPEGIAKTLDLLDEIDPHNTLPVVSTHAGYRFGKQKYMHDPDTLRRIADRKGIVGLIMAQHQLNDGLRRCRRTKDFDDAFEVICTHIDKIKEVTGSYDQIAIGTDFDGFIKPTMNGLESSGDLFRLERALRQAYPDNAEQITSGNSLRVLRTLWPQ